MHHICNQVATWKILIRHFETMMVLSFFIIWCTASPNVVKEIQCILDNWPSTLPPALGPWQYCRVGPHARECDPHMRWPRPGWLPHSTYLYLGFHEKAKSTQQGNLLAHPWSWCSPHTDDPNIYLYEAGSQQIAEQTNKARKPSSVIASFCTETKRWNCLPILQNLPN